jgi:hypothetical protein
VAKELVLTPGAISQFLDPESDAKPSDAVLKLFELVVTRPFAPIGRAGSRETALIPEDLADGLRALTEDEREKLAEITRAALGLVRSIELRRRNPTKSDDEAVAGVARKLNPLILEEAKRQTRKSGAKRSKRGAGPTERTLEPS